MLDSVGVLVTSIITNAQTALGAAVIAAGLLIGGFTWALGNSEHGKAKVTAALVGGAAILTCLTVAKAFVALPH